MTAISANACATGCITAKADPAKSVSLPRYLNDMERSTQITGLDDLNCHITCANWLVPRPCVIKRRNASIKMTANVWLRVSVSSCEICEAHSGILRCVPSRTDHVSERCEYQAHHHVDRHSLQTRISHTSLRAASFHQSLFQ